jgi:hypothetical protein
VIRDFAVVVFVVVAVGAVIIDGWVVLRVSLKNENFILQFGEKLD